ncbi:hypothetical protein VB773_19620 [Haloarculaceae archaeon H-GB2-1]|nr:hypothetical protein [Haloarculaceae archaeon H-GB1-1]MEA5409569.1 hypothetical protein [Haloarculaceae archaeon H-GB2-1]
MDERDRIYYLFDYGDEWCFYAILKEIGEEHSSGIEPDVVKEKGEPMEQYHRPAKDGSHSSYVCERFPKKCLTGANPTQCC